LAERVSAKAAEHQRILDAAEICFAERGFAETRMQDIAAEAKVSLRSVYGAAKGKTKLYGALHELRAGDLLVRIEGALSDESRDPVGSLMDVIGVVATFLMEHPDFLRIQLREGGTWALDETERVLLVEERHKSDRLIERLFRRGIRAGSFHSEDPDMMLANLRALEQIQLAAWASRRGRLSKRAAIESIQRQARRLFCQ
jgi:AcrR family transcriptional regulator